MIPVAGHVMLENKFKNEFNITQAPQEIAGFLLAPYSLKGELGNNNCADLCKQKRIESITKQNSVKC